jgi:hypothetical protein
METSWYGSAIEEDFGTFIVRNVPFLLPGKGAMEIFPSYTTAQLGTSYRYSY